jgi:hypothetical protein
MSPDHFGAVVRAVASPLCPPTLKKEVMAIQKTADLVGEVHVLIDKTNAILDSAENDPHLFLKCVKEARANLETLAKLTGKLSPGGSNNTQINTGISPEEFSRTVSHVIKALEPFPDARIAVLAALEGVKVIECLTN